MSADTSISAILKSAGFTLPGFGRGYYTPELPEPKNEQERQALGELQTCLNQKKEQELRVIRETLLYLHNILEDMYIEARQCAEYGGIAQKGIRFLGRWDMEQAESIRQMQEYGMDQPFHHEKCPPAVS